MKTLSFLLLALPVAGSSGSCSGNSDAVQKENDTELAIIVSSDTSFKGYPQVCLQNSIFRAVIRTRERPVQCNGKYDSCIRDWILKSTGQDQVVTCIDGSAHRPAGQHGKLCVTPPGKKPCGSSTAMTLLMNIRSTPTVP